MIYDITRTVTPKTAVWPGDSPYSIAHVLRRAEGASVNLTTISLSPHTGSHADAYYHYEDAPTLYPATMPLEAYVGRARVITVTRRDGPLSLDEIGENTLIGAERLLIHSHVSDLPDEQWPAEFPYLSVDLIDASARCGIRLIGLDSPSVDEFSSTELPCHHAIRRNGLVNLELLFLRDVPDGDYDLTALPLKLDGACGSPVRAILRPLRL